MLVRRVSEQELRRIFNEGRYFERMLANEFDIKIVYDMPQRRGDRRIRGSRSQLVEYWDKSGDLIAVVHQYRMRDGSLGASGRPDLKRLRHENVLYFLEKNAPSDILEWWSQNHDGEGEAR